MDNLWAQLILQLGIAGLIVFVGYQIAMKLIASWSTMEAERNKIWASAEEQRTKAIQEGFGADMAAHQEFARYLNKLVQGNARIESKIDTAFDLTPVRGIRERVDSDQPPSEPSVIVEDQRAIPTPVPVKRATPPQGVGIYGIDKPFEKPRGK